MKLRSKLLALALMTLLLPWSAWLLLQELEGFLRESQEQALQAAARTISGALPVGFQTRLMFLPKRFVPLVPLTREPVLDGYGWDWPEAAEGQLFESADGQLGVKLFAGDYNGRLYLLLNVHGAQREAGRVPRGHVALVARDPRGLYRFTVQPEAPGPLQLNSDLTGSGFLEGFWLDSEQGFWLELVLPLAATGTDIDVRVTEMNPVAFGEQPRTAGSGQNPGEPGWIGLVGRWGDVSDWLTRSAVPGARSWLVDRDGWVLASSSSAMPADTAGTEQTTWVQRVLYRIVAGSRTDLLGSSPLSDPMRFQDVVTQRALRGQEATGWQQEADTAVVWNTVAVPLEVEGQVRGAVIMQSTSEGLLLMTNRAMGRLLFTTLLLTLLLAAGLWGFASRLSRRVQRLGGAVSQAMEEGADPDTLPLINDRDELGELARNNQKLLRAVSEYSQYLQTLASKLSHELKTPLAITRSSLDNLGSFELDENAAPFLERAREGVDRQTAIVRAMSEASRLEAAIGAAEWEDVDLAQVVRSCCEGYRAVHPRRRLELSLPPQPCRLNCAPDLLAQALDKLVDNAMTLSGPEDTVTIELLCPGDSCTLSVRNSGSRLPDELQERLFDSLVSLREKRGNNPHLGLGLYIVRLVAAAHGGTVTARNLPDAAGVEFQIGL